MSVRPICRLVLILALAVCTACSDRPKAPPLNSEAVYQNEQIGLRFLVPTDWPVQSRAVLPAGPLTRPIVLVSYQRAGGERPAEFTLVAVDLPPDADLNQFLAEYRVGSERWSARTGIRQVTINGEPATRYLLTRIEGKEEFQREVTAFRRGERVYFFIVAFAGIDISSRDAVRVSVGSVTWMH